MATAPPTALAGPGDPVFYPERDGKPMAETPVHRDLMFDLIAGLRDRFAADPEVYVSGNMFLYFVEGDPRRNVSPDVMVVRGVDRDRYRATYKTWEEGGHAPDLVIELSSRSTRREDLREKFALYRDVLKVREYLLFDPFGEYLRPSLRGFRLVGTEYESIPLEDGCVRSHVLDLRFGAVGQDLRLYDGPSGRLIPTRVEQLRELEARTQTTDATRRTLERRAEHAEGRAERAEERNRVLEARVERAEESGRTLAERVEESDRRAQESLDLLKRELERLRADRRAD